MSASSSNDMSHNEINQEESGIEVNEKSHAFERRIVSYRFVNQLHLDLVSFFRGTLHEFKKTTRLVLERENNVKVSLTFIAKFLRHAMTENSDTNIDEIQ